MLKWRFAAFTTVCLMTIAPAGAQTKSCQDVLVAEGDYSISRTYADKIKSLFAWRKAAAAKYGTDFEAWSNADGRRVTCEQRQASPGRRWFCKRSARPCRTGANSVLTAIGRPDPTAPTPTEIYGRPTLKHGSSGEYVRNLQRTLQDYGIVLSIDGSFGRATQRAVRQFQRNQRLKVDGKVGPATKLRLLG